MRTARRGFAWGGCAGWARAEGAEKRAALALAHARGAYAAVICSSMRGNRRSGHNTSWGRGTFCAPRCCGPVAPRPPCGLSRSITCCRPFSHQLRSMRGSRPRGSALSRTATRSAPSLSRQTRTARRAEPWPTWQRTSRAKGHWQQVSPHTRMRALTVDQQDSHAAAAD